MGGSGSQQLLAVGALLPQQHPWSRATISEHLCAPEHPSYLRPSLRDSLRLGMKRYAPSADQVVLHYLQPVCYIQPGSL